MVLHLLFILLFSFIKWLVFFSIFYKRYLFFIVTLSYLCFRGLVFMKYFYFFVCWCCINITLIAIHLFVCFVYVLRFHLYLYIHRKWIEAPWVSGFEGFPHHGIQHIIDTQMLNLSLLYPVTGRDALLTTIACSFRQNSSIVHLA